jgi:tripartite-type tricarboxylate transporter receptor subunit TctC
VHYAKRKKRHTLARMLSCCAIVALPLASFLPVGAQEKFPSRPIELIVPTPPGGGVDITGRMLAEAAESVFGVPVVVVNQPGATGGVGVARMVAAKPDGYTVAYVWNAPVTIVPQLLPVSYNLQSFAPVSQTTGGTPLIFCVSAKFPASNGKEFIEVLQKNPGRYSYGNDGPGGMVQLAGERLFKPLDVKLLAVPYKGAAETLQAFLGGHVDVYGGSVPAVGPHIKDGAAKCLLVTTRERNSAAPDAIGAADLGLPDQATELWRGVIAPKDVPADRLKILEEGFRKAAQSARLTEYAQKNGERVVAGTSADFQKMIASEYKDFGQLVRELGLATK